MIIVHARLNVGISVVQSWKLPVLRHTMTVSASNVVIGRYEDFDHDKLCGYQLLMIWCCFI